MAHIENVVLFREVQSWYRLWFRPLLIISLIPVVPAGIIFYLNLTLAVPPAALIAASIMLLVFVTGCLPIWFSSMITEIRSDGVHLKYPPYVFWTKRMPADQIKSVERRTSNPGLRGTAVGWGIHMGPDRGWTYNVRGNQFIRIETTDGAVRHLGTQHPEEFLQAVEAIRKGSFQRRP